MQTLTLEQLRAAAATSGAPRVTVKAKGDEFFVHVKTHNGEAILAKARSNEPRRFGNPFHAMSVLHKLGIVTGAYDLSQYQPSRGNTGSARPDQAEAMRRTHEDAAYTRWFRESVQASIDDPRPSIDHETARAEFAERRAGLAADTKANG